VLLVELRQGDAQWAAIVDWTIHALIQAEASGVTQANVARMRASEDPVIQHLIGADWSAAQALDLERDWAARVIAAVGNHGEVYERTVGARSPLRLPRGLNALWTTSGLMRPLPAR
jgi:general L-amino acid transport system substrate-binding protein